MPKERWRWQTNFIQTVEALDIGYDIVKRPEVAAAFAEIVSRFGTVDAFVRNEATAGPETLCIGGGQGIAMIVER
ncbi:hypothetical protein AusDCA_2797 [Desulfitobacterium sp. AusDCA]